MSRTRKLSTHERAIKGALDSATKTINNIRKKGEPHVGKQKLTPEKQLAMLRRMGPDHQAALLERLGPERFDRYMQRLRQSEQRERTY